MAKPRKDGEQAGGDGGFEQALGRLEEIVERMEAGDLPLEEAMGLFEEGVKLGQSCQKRLDEAERRITVLLERADGSLQEQAFDPDTAVEPPTPTPPPATGRGAASTSGASSRRASPAPPSAASRQPVLGGVSDTDDIPF